MIRNRAERCPSEESGSSQVGVGKLVQAKASAERLAVAPSFRVPVRLSLPHLPNSAQAEAPQGELRW